VHSSLQGTHTILLLQAGTARDARTWLDFNTINEACDGVPAPAACQFLIISTIGVSTELLVVVRSICRWSGLVTGV